MDQTRWWVLDGPPEEGRAALEELLEEATMIITEDQKELVTHFVPNGQRYIDEVEVDGLLDALQDQLQKVGYDQDHELNDTGRMLSKLCKELDEQN